MAAIAVVGARRGVGKTKLVEKIIRWLVAAGFNVQFVKRSERRYPFAGKDNERAFLAGARRAVTVFADAAHVLESIRGLQDYLSEWSGVTVIEGFRDEEVPKVVVAKSASDLPVPGVEGNVIAVIGPKELCGDAKKAYPAAKFFELGNEGELRSWVIEEVSRYLLATVPRKDCGACGFRSCSELLSAVVAGSEKITKCVMLGEGDVEVRVNSKRVFLTKFPAGVIKAVCTALISQLKLYDEDVKTVEIKIRVKPGEVG